MKTLKAKLYRKSKLASQTGLSAREAAEIWDMDHDHADPDLQMYRIQRSPRQENL